MMCKNVFSRVFGQGMAPHQGALHGSWTLPFSLKALVEGGLAKFWGLPVKCAPPRGTSWLMDPTTNRDVVILIVVFSKIANLIPI